MRNTQPFLRNSKIEAWPSTSALRAYGQDERKGGISLMLCSEISVIVSLAKSKALNERKLLIY